jgi:hypothetical protein
MSLENSQTTQKEELKKRMTLNCQLFKKRELTQRVKYNHREHRGEENAEIAERQKKRKFFKKYL